MAEHGQVKLSVDMAAMVQQIATAFDVPPEILGLSVPDTGLLAPGECPSNSTPYVPVKDFNLEPLMVGNFWKHDFDQSIGTMPLSNHAMGTVLDFNPIPQPPPGWNQAHFEVTGDAEQLWAEMADEPVSTSWDGPDIDPQAHLWCTAHDLHWLDPVHLAGDPVECNLGGYLRPSTPLEDKNMITKARMMCDTGLM